MKTSQSYAASYITIRVLCIHSCDKWGHVRAVVLAVLYVQMILKCADIGHLAASPRTHRRWAFQLEEEFFRQVLQFMSVFASHAEKGEPANTS